MKKRFRPVCKSLHSSSKIYFVLRLSNSGFYFQTQTMNSSVLLLTRVNARKLVSVDKGWRGASDDVVVPCIQTVQIENATYYVGTRSSADSCISFADLRRTVLGDNSRHRDTCKHDITCGFVHVRNNRVDFPGKLY